MGGRSGGVIFFSDLASGNALNPPAKMSGAQALASPVLAFRARHQRSEGNARHRV